MSAGNPLKLMLRFVGKLVGLAMGLYELSLIPRVGFDIFVANVSGDLRKSTRHGMGGLPSSSTKPGIRLIVPESGETGKMGDNCLEFLVLSG
jgi:hypothetical protein